MDERLHDHDCDHEADDEADRHRAEADTVSARQNILPVLQELETAVNKILKAIERRKKSYAFPWQLATVVRLGMIMPNAMYDWVVSRNSFRE